MKKLFAYMLMVFGLISSANAYVTSDASDLNVKSRCRDGMYSTSVGRGTCSGHGGVAGRVDPIQQIEPSNNFEVKRVTDDQLVSIKPPENFRKAKAAAVKSIYFDTSKELYCDCPITWQGNKGSGAIDIASCGYKVRKNATRANRVEWEHVLPISIVGKQYQCWKNGGRKNCQKVSEEFNKAEADLHNFLPVIGEVNGDRSDFMYGMLNESPHQYGSCQTVIDFKARKMMPREEIRGIVARITLYMYDRYGMRLSKQDQQLFNAWNKMYPVTEWEKERNQRTACVMGWGNNYISDIDLNKCK
ncbi:endonuclease [Wohlfahrtiimonas chitiniclastica]|uniref:endonuclease n=1 Tax=Wohlfahrtiimonas chitiniclastica TaxID=400946 RepID=UPI001FEDF592|nr:endonuclease [Wohlfahrtiimonas chitiniclastica]